jgi:isochorismate pyruvate lyase
MRVECRTIEEAREHIDRIDREIVKLMAERGRYVHQVVRFKSAPHEIRVPARHEAVIARVRALAAEHGLEPDLAEQVYRTMMEGFIACELRELAARGTV